MDEIAEVLVEDPRWEAVGIGALAGRAVAAGLGAAGLPPPGYVAGVLACDDARIAALNAAWRGKAGPTNVLSWPAHRLAPALPGRRPARPPAPAPGRPVPLGDIAIAFGTCAREAEALGLAMADHAFHLLLHGTLHLLGYDHETEADAALMEGIETETLVRMGLHDPYSPVTPGEESASGKER
jgi:probable rRNA maturation factor